MGQAHTSSQTEQEGGLHIVSSIFAPYDFARHIVGSTAEVSMLVPPGAETHSYEPSPSDLIMLSECDVFIYVGGESDAWIEDILDSLDNSDLVEIRLVDLVDTVEEAHEVSGETHESNHEHSHDTDDEHAEDHSTHEIDEHVWTSLRNSQIIVSALAEVFASLDENNAQTFLSNAEEYNTELALLDEEITQIVNSGKRTTVVFGDRFPFRYFADDYGLTCYAAFPGCSTAVDTNPATLVFLIETTKQEDLPSVFYIELSDKRIAHTLSEETGAVPLLFHSAHNISKNDFDAGVSYLDLMKENANNLKIALQ